MEQKNMPTHIAIIMDGNRRWAKKRGLASNLGHKEGAKTLKKLCKHIEKLGIPYVSVFAFSTENFKRSEEEVNGLMNLFITMFTNEFKFLLEDGVKVVFSGKRYPLPEKVLKAMDENQVWPEDNRRRGDYLFGEGYPEGLEEAVHRYIARSNAKIFLIQPEDIFQVDQQQNVPGTDRDKYPNWRHKLPVNIEDMENTLAYYRNIAGIKKER